jgi:hypothetical protein
METEVQMDDQKNDENDFKYAAADIGVGLV